MSHFLFIHSYITVVHLLSLALQQTNSRSLTAFCFLSLDINMTKHIARLITKKL